MNEPIRTQENCGGAFTVAGFCASHGMSRAKFYQLLSAGEAPRIMKVGRKTLISTEAAAAWRRQMESKTLGQISSSPVSA